MLTIICLWEGMLHLWTKVSFYMMIKQVDKSDNLISVQMHRVKQTVFVHRHVLRWKFEKNKQNKKLSFLEQKACQPWEYLFPNQ